MRLTRLLVLLSACLVIGRPLVAQTVPQPPRINSTAPPLSPAEAVAVLQASHSDRNVTGLHFYRDLDGPTVAFTGASGPTLGPWDWPAEREPRRLDGTPLSRPPDLYGPDVLFVPPFGFGSGREHARSHDRRR